MNMLEKAIVSVRGTDITPVLRCEVDMGFARELEGSVPAEYMTCNDEEVREEKETRSGRLLHQPCPAPPVLPAPRSAAL